MNNVYVGNNNSNQTKEHGITFCGALAIAFIVLKLCDVIDWGWQWVLAPIWIPLALAVLYIVITIIIVLIKGDE